MDFWFFSVNLYITAISNLVDDSIKVRYHCLCRFFLLVFLNKEYGIWFMKYHERAPIIHFLWSEQSKAHNATIFFIVSFDLFPYLHNFFLSRILFFIKVWSADSSKFVSSLILSGAISIIFPADIKNRFQSFFSLVIQKPILALMHPHCNDWYDFQYLHFFRIYVQIKPFEMQSNWVSIWAIGNVPFVCLYLVAVSFVSFWKWWRDWAQWIYADVVKMVFWKSKAIKRMLTRYYLNWRPIERRPYNYFNKVNTKVTSWKMRKTATILHKNENFDFCCCE